MLAASCSDDCGECGPDPFTWLYDDLLPGHWKCIHEEYSYEVFTPLYINTVWTFEEDGQCIMDGDDDWTWTSHEDTLFIWPKGLGSRVELLFSVSGNELALRNPEYNTIHVDLRFSRLK